MIRALLKPAFWLTLLFVAWASLMPTDLLPPVLFSWWDKAEHALAYAALSVSGCLAYGNKRAQVLIALLILGGAIELLQHASGWRTGDLIDWLADNVGIAIGAVAARVSARWL